MTARYRLSPAAQSDLDEIWDYSAEHWGADQEDGYIRDLAGAIERIASGKRRGHSCDEIRLGYFKYACQSHVIFYKLEESAIVVVRVLHRRMDFNRRL
ncbi:MAG TPA: type II toxin-antitoxin system RelE/ParE family toxin [Rhizomicrobium sp.]|jgi:toxin ParE1/3/4|nr:type II toxin-antitoxin system RelE/ParE family toxin [Rhizomicrobium sp.]